MQRAEPGDGSARCCSSPGGRGERRVSASRIPSAISTAPVTRWRSAANRPPPRIVRRRRAVATASTAAHTRSIAARMAPSSTNCATTCPRSGATNCGRKARKKRAILGFSSPVANPCASSRAVPPRAGSGVSTVAGEPRWVRIIRTPSQRRYTAPASFTAVNAAAEVARIAERPSAAARLCTRVAASRPSAVSMPAPAPRSALRAMISACAGPGSSTSSVAGPAYASKVEGGMIQLIVRAPGIAVMCAGSAQNDGGPPGSHGQGVRFVRICRARTRWGPCAQQARS